MSPKLALPLALLLTATLPASAKDQAYRRVLVCAGPDANMELYLPEERVSGGGIDNVDLKKPATGLYALDLSAAGKGKPLEPVRVSLEGETIVIDQFTRKGLTSRVPVAGGTVDFDNRFGTKAQCPAFNEDPEIE